MLVTCPSCRSSYRLSDEAIGDGRTLRCARCGDTWFEARAPIPIPPFDDAPQIDAFDAPEAEQAAAIAQDADVAAAPPPRERRRPPPPPKRRPRAPLRLATVVATAGLTILVLLVGLRTSVVEAAPSLATLYRFVGLPVNVRGLTIGDLASSEQVEDGAPLLLVTGTVSNVSRILVDVPRIRLAVKSGDGREIYAWTTVAARTRLAPGETSTFRARLASPPAEGQAIAVRFFGRRDMVANAH